MPMSDTDSNGKKWEDRYFEESRRATERIEESMIRIEDKLDSMRRDVTRIEAQGTASREKLDGLDTEVRTLRQLVSDKDLQIRADMQTAFADRDKSISTIDRQVSTVMGKAAGAGASSAMLITLLSFVYKLVTSH